MPIGYPFLAISLYLKGGGRLTKNIYFFEFSLTAPKILIITVKFCILVQLRSLSEYH